MDTGGGDGVIKCVAQIIKKELRPGPVLPMEVKWRVFKGKLPPHKVAACSVYIRRGVARCFVPVTHCSRSTSSDGATAQRQN